jgi:hypothetical protein
MMKEMTPTITNIKTIKKRVMKKKMNNTKNKQEAFMNVIKKNIDDHNMMMKITAQALEKNTIKLLLMSREKIMSHTPHGLCK